MFAVITFPKTEYLRSAPLTADSGNWYRYVIAFKGSNSIHGRRQGGLKAVTEAVEEIVTPLNERRLGHSKKRCRVCIALKKKPHRRQSITLPVSTNPVPALDR